jgi:hypothetical protein
MKEDLTLSVKLDPWTHILVQAIAEGDGISCEEVVSRLVAYGVHLDMHEGRFETALRWYNTADQRRKTVTMCRHFY